MDIKNLKTCLPQLIKKNVVPFIWGMQGIGKTQVVKQVANELGIGFVHLHLATQEVGDLVGLLMPTKAGTVKHARPRWFPTKGEGIIFLDECNRAHPDVMQAMFSFITARTIHTHVLPEGWKIVAAGNYQTDGFTVTDTSDQAWMSRFCHINLKPTIEEFVLHAEKRGAMDVADFVNENPDMLQSKNQKIPELHITPDSRSWLDLLNPLETCEFSEELRYELYAGIVGSAAAASFLSYKKKSEKKLRLRNILQDYRQVQTTVLTLTGGKETRFDALSAPLDELVTRLSEPANKNLLDDDGVANLKAYFLDIPLELVCQMCKKLSPLSFRGKDALLNDVAFNNRLFGVK